MALHPFARSAAPVGRTLRITIENRGRCLPRLRLAARQSKSANVDIISGATYTSEGFLQSLQEALVKANKV